MDDSKTRSVGEVEPKRTLNEHKQAKQEHKRVSNTDTPGTQKASREHEEKKQKRRQRGGMRGKRERERRWLSAHWRHVKVGLTSRVL
jgi:hypothetical protein